MTFLEKNHYKPPQTTMKPPRKTTMNHHKPLQTTMNHYKPPQTTMNHHKPPQSLIQNDIWYWILDSDWLNSGSHDIFLRILEKNYHKPPQTTTNHYEPPWTTMNNHEPLWSTMNHHKPLQTTMNHYEPPRNIMNHHETSQLNYYKQCEYMWGNNDLGMGVCICVWEYESVRAHGWKGLWHGCV